MLVEVYSRKLNDSQALKTYVHRRLGFALDRFTNRITRVHVRLADINGPRGGKDKSCLMQVFFDQMPHILIESLDESIFSAIDNAAERARRAITSRFGKQQRIQRLAVLNQREQLETIYSESEVVQQNSEASKERVHAY
ncbi:HPF/RaiA family ribosome-associated protein [Aliikangiella marina]|uniref:HPF/RaiA family ribosome-associated protein n=1 Tax=Aliikangiella marina TaxID=1712262 RepID=A0A545THU2_9GAMM|nr:HPF/RaiA family ribosome-associated protein [Aliikangiella marina]TQV76794.1 HPF/RaiA family ribosome-associated protein [Aliikangiella marina]